MTEKRVKAWAVVDRDGKLFRLSSSYLVCPTKKDATNNCGYADLERVVPVTVIVEES